MKISKSSWHYRFNKFMDDDFTYEFSEGQFTTCSYIRATIGSMFTALFKSVVLMIFGAFGLFFVGSMIGVPIVVFLGKVPYELSAILCIVGWAFAAAGLLVLFAKQVQEWMKARRSKTGAVKKEPSVFVQAIIDKHNRFCTLVTAED